MLEDERMWFCCNFLLWDMIFLGRVAISNFYLPSYQGNFVVVSFCMALPGEKHASMSFRPSMPMVPGLRLGKDRRSDHGGEVGNDGGTHPRRLFVLLHRLDRWSGNHCTPCSVSRSTGRGCGHGGALDIWCPPSTKNRGRQCTSFFLSRLYVSQSSFKSRLDIFWERHAINGKKGILGTRDCGLILFPRERLAWTYNVCIVSLKKGRRSHGGKGNR